MAASYELHFLFSERKPKFSEEMGPVTLIENRTGIIPCPIVASPAPVITWRKNSIPIILKGKVLEKYKDKVKLAANGLDLEIMNVEKEDGGTYTCQGENRNGRVSDDSDVTIGSKCVMRELKHRLDILTRCFTLYHSLINFCPRFSDYHER